MRFALRKQEKIASAYSEGYLKEHILSSLKIYFEKRKNDDIFNDMDSNDTYTYDGREISYPVLRINDVADKDSMLEFAIVGQQYDVLKLSFLGRMKG
nr:MAG TPA: hypothetical protein [Caudoviricetes sp.]